MMESAAVFRSFQHSVGTVSLMRSSVERPGMVSMHNATWLTSSKSPPAFGWKLICSPTKRATALVSCVKTTDDAVEDKSNGSLEKIAPRGATFPHGFEELVLGVCDETEIAELKMKIGDFEMHLKRNISAEPILPVFSPTPAPSETEAEPAHATIAPPEKPPSGKPSPFRNDPVEKTQKLAELEASGASGYVIVKCPMVGLFRRGRMKKGKRMPPAVGEGSVIKEGKIICFIDQFGKETAVRSDAAGEVIKVLFDDGEAVGYGDPLFAVMPRFK